MKPELAIFDRVITPLGERGTITEIRDEPDGHVRADVRYDRPGLGSVRLRLELLQPAANEGAR